MLLEQDNTARSYIVQTLKGKMVIFTKPVLAICLPAAVLAACSLYFYDTERRHTWIVALASVPVMLMAIRMLPYIYLLFRDRWTIEENSIRIRGSIVGRIKREEICGWQILPEEQLPGYYNVAVATKWKRAAILIDGQRFPIREVRGQMEKRFGEEGAPSNGGKRSSLNSAFTPRRG